MRLGPIILLATLVALAMGACDTTVTVVDTGSTNETSVVVSGSSGTAGPCGAPFPVLPWSDGSGTAATVTGGPIQCASTVEDGAGHSWEALCTVDGCSCSFDGAEVCTCQNDPPLAVCDSVDNCCPQGWPRL